jgi:multidrug efflux pump subunit AcrB
MISWCSRRPAVVWAASVAIVLAGAMAFVRLPLATRGAVELPRLQIMANWPGASPEMVEMYLTAPIEGAVQGVRGVHRSNSESRDESANITVELQAGRDVQIVRLAILERLEMLRPELPAGVAPPAVTNYVPQELQEAPLVRYTVSGPLTAGTLQRLLEDRVVPRVSAIPGVGGISVRGGVEPGITVSYDPELLRRIGVRPQQLADVVRDARVVRSVGIERRGASERPVVVRDEPKTIEALEALPIAVGDRVFRLGELASVHPEEDARGMFFRIDGEPAVAISIARQAGADAVATAAEVRAAMAEAQRLLPAAVRISLTSDDSENLSEQLRELAIRGAVALLAVMLVLVVAMRDSRGVGIVMLTVLVAVGGTALSLHLLEIPANLLTLAGLAMGVGVLVQNGLVVALRVREAAPVAQARAAAAGRMKASVMGATLTTAVVLLPFLYLQGNARAAFVPFAAAFLLGLAWSVVAALLIVPAIGAGKPARGSGRFERRLRRRYARMVGGIVRFRWAVLSLTTIAIGVVGWFFWSGGTRFSFGGYGRQDTVISASISFPRGSDPQSLSDAIGVLEQMAVRSTGIDQVVVQSYGPSAAGMVVRFTDEAALTALPMILEDEMINRAAYIGGARISVRGQGPGFSSGAGSITSSRYSIKVLGYAYDDVERFSEDLQQRLGRIARVRDVRITAGSFFGGERSFAATLEPNRDALARYGVNATELAQAVSREVRGPVGRQLLEIGGEEIPVSLKTAGSRERTLDELRLATIPAPGDAAVRIGDLATVGERETQSSITREDQQYVRQVQYDFRGPNKLAQRTHESFMGSIAVPAGMSVEDVSSGGFLPDESDRGLWLVFGVGVILVALAVAVVFDSVWAAGIVLASLPIALAGVAAAFLIADAPFTREAAVGVIIVIGLAVNQTILLADAALRRRLAGPLGMNAIIRASAERSGMIVIVTATTLASLIPLAWGTDANSLFGAIALATAGGIAAGTIGTMLVLPALFVGRRRQAAGGRDPGIV